MSTITYFTDYLSKIKSYNSDLRDRVDDYDILVGGIKAIESLAKICLQCSVSLWQNSLCSSTLSLLCSCQFSQSFHENTRLISFIGSPLSILALGKAAGRQFQASLDPLKGGAERIYNFSKGLRSVAYLGAMGWVVHNGLKIVGQKVETRLVGYLEAGRLETFCKASETASRLASHTFGVITKFYMLASIVQPVIHLSELYQIKQLRAGAKIDSGVIEECFGTKAVALDEREKAQLGKYERMRRLLFVNALVEMIAKRVLIFSPALAPASAILLLGTLGVKLSTDLYWLYQVRTFKGETLSRTDALLTVVALTTLAAIPFVTLPGYAPYAFGVIATSIALDLVLCKVNFRALGQRESSLKSPTAGYASSSVLNQYE